MFKFEITATTAKELKSSIAEFNTVFFPEEDTQLTLNLIEEENVKASQSVPTAIVETEVLSNVSVTEETPVVEPIAPIYETAAPQAPADEEEDDEEIEPVTSGDKDSRGIFWDARVHSANKSFNKDGSWRTRRNLPIGLVEKVEAEQMCRTLPPPVVPYNPPPMEPQVKYPIHHTPVIPPAPAVVAPVAPPPPVEPVTRSKPMHSYVSFKQNFMGTLSILQSTGKIDKAYIQSLCEYFKTDGIWNVLYNEQHCTELYECLVANDLITKVG